MRDPQRICGACWWIRGQGGTPPRVLNDWLARCFYCGAMNRSGLYVVINGARLTPVEEID